MAKQDTAAIVAAVLAALQQQGSAPAKPQTKPSWSFDILAQEGAAAIVKATTPKGETFKALATVSDKGRVNLGFKLDGTDLARSFHKLLGAAK